MNSTGENQRGEAISMKRLEFLFIASPLKMRGATASLIRPPAIAIRRNG